MNRHPARASGLCIAVDANIPGTAQTFGRHGTIQPFDGRGVTAADLRHADVVIVRSVTRMDAALLRETRVGFVGTATIGTDHLDVTWLEEQGIRWASAPGCNADAAAQYTLALIFASARRLGFDPAERRIGIVGCGNVGGRLARLLGAVDAPPHALCDPPRAAAGDSGFQSMDAITRCDLISFHVPLTRGGEWPTHHLVNEALLRRLAPGTLLINTSRGDVVEAGPLFDWLASGRGHAALDVWPGEPRIGAERIAATTVATPHVAGYSADGKLAGTLAVYRAFREWLRLDTAVPDLIAALDVRTLPAAATRSIADAVLTACPVERDDANLRAVADPDPRCTAAGFDRLRRSYPDRRDFAGWRMPDGAEPAIRSRLHELGFR